MKITVFGAAGDVGSRIVKEALSRGHSVTAVVRKEAQLNIFQKGVDTKIGFANLIEDVEKLLINQDVVISAIRPAQGREMELPTSTHALLTGAGNSQVRSVIVGGAASLGIPGKSTTVLTEPGFLPESVVNIATACSKQHQVCINHDNQNWSYASPSAMLRPGTQTGEFRVGNDELLFDLTGISHISMEDFAIALIDEAEQPKHIATRFTVGY